MLTPEQQLAYAYSWAEWKTATFTAQDDEARQQVIDWKCQVLASLAIDTPAKWDGHFNLRRLRFPRLPEGALTLSPTLGVVELDLAENNIEALDTSPSLKKSSLSQCPNLKELQRELLDPTDEKYVDSKVSDTLMLVQDEINRKSNASSQAIKTRSKN